MTAPLYKLDENVKVKLTPKQREQLLPLVERARQNPSTGFVIGQYYGEVPTMNFQFVTVEEMQEGIDEAIRIRDGKAAPQADGSGAE